MKSIADKLLNHYSEAFEKYGPTSEGVDWGSDANKLMTRYQNMINVIRFAEYDRPSLLDVGCGYGGLLDFIKERKLDIIYTGIDGAQNMIRWAKSHHASNHGTFISSEFMDFSPEACFDYVVCNGILTQKLDVTNLDMDIYAAKLIKRMFQTCNIGVAFNIMTTKSNYYSKNLYYRSPVEILAWCLSEVTGNIKIDHSYGMYEYTVYLYK
ncbi:methyltransferase domain-containing protein [Methylobacterium sp. NEAU 140]|uniref:class I SAM-dependent methyltransferase n=1 Tax=Methylobacterium sp. NEAU 140 TaxID=3064945 RepID=UPI00273541D5|nr:class I SAM-dependent methyltransferase [Methylobacterium sp. NEAU 140]MDP4026007.1 methyltransferase domain-containing protein [Methylobacterium sp. NEAU 140]